AGAVARAALAHAVVCEPEPSRVVEHDVVRRAQWLSVALGVDGVDRTARDFDSLDGPVAWPRSRWRGPRQRETHHLVPIEASPVVAHVHRAVGTDRCAIWSTADIGDDIDRTVVHVDAAQRAACDLDQDDRAVVHDHWTFWETQT